VWDGLCWTFFLFSSYEAPGWRRDVHGSLLLCGTPDAPTAPVIRSPLPVQHFLGHTPIPTDGSEYPLCPRFLPPSTDLLPSSLPPPAPCLLRVLVVPLLERGILPDFVSFTFRFSWTRRGRHSPSTLRGTQGTFFGTVAYHSLRGVKHLVPSL